MPPGARWALGLGLAFLSGVALVTLSSIFPPVMIAAVVVAFTLAVAAGFTLSSWLAGLALFAAAAVGGFAGSLLVVLLTPDGSAEGLTGIGAVLIVFGFFAILALAPLTMVLFAGIGMGKWQGIALGQPHALSERDIAASRWVAALGMVFAGGFFTFYLSNMPGLIGMRMDSVDVPALLPGIVYAIVLSATCLLAAWLLRSWRESVVVALAYMLVAAAVMMQFGGGSSGFPIAGFLLYIVLPAVVMTAIGAAIRMYRSGRAGPPPRQDLLPA
ncbi:MAG TPA: hypothetical protein VF812_01210 [Ktedonobacterales bacterium]